ncbi:hypothetical protein RFI_37063 [Reticulomyxa filosa]|uniref:Uncharacterized protein n=1 Tax=Reticulomyxa filosa TaxID=46433 RepID=X6LH15_RETFI|nr:hypothetical protein RFI_37063 [Reticulomyxa filosa]|eukprot:ETO00382.1 hypothetical protein RFI_37063 [Reticulomyxa filosa]
MNKKLLAYVNVLWWAIPLFIFFYLIITSNLVQIMEQNIIHFFLMRKKTKQFITFLFLLNPFTYTNLFHCPTSLSLLKVSIIIKKMGNMSSSKMKGAVNIMEDHQEQTDIEFLNSNGIDDPESNGFFALESIRKSILDKYSDEEPTTFGEKLRESYDDIESRQQRRKFEKTLENRHKPSDSKPESTEREIAVATSKPKKLIKKKNSKGSAPQELPIRRTPPNARFRVSQEFQSRDPRFPAPGEPKTKHRFGKKNKILFKKSFHFFLKKKGDVKKFTKKKN